MIFFNFCFCPQNIIYQNSCHYFAVDDFGYLETIFLKGQSVDISYTDESGQKTSYVNFGNGSSWNTANPFCKSLGGQLPMVDTLGKHNFLKNTFSTDYWLSLQANVKYVN